MRAVIAATISLLPIFSGAALGQVPPSNLYESQIQDLNRSAERRQREVQEQQQRDFETNQRFGAPRSQSLPGERPPGCPAGSAGC
jgi:hypothetical protein